MKESLEKIIRKAKYALAIPAIALAINQAEAQNIVTVQSRPLPSLHNTNGKIVFIDQGGDRYWSKLDTTNGQETLDLDAGNYSMILDQEGTFRITGNRTINSEATFNMQPIENVPTNSAPYTDILQVFEILTYTYPGSGNPYNHRWTTPIRLWIDTNQLAWMKPITDSVLVRLNYKTDGAINYNIRNADSTGARILYLTNSQMPIDGQGFLGYTDPKAGNDSGYTDVNMDINMSLVQNNDQAYQTIAKENGRNLMLYDYSQCPNHLFRATNLGGPLILEFHPDEYMTLNILYKMKPLTDMTEYQDTVINNVDLELPSKLRLLSPVDGASGIPTKTNLVWKKLNGQEIDKYMIQLVTDTLTLANLLQDSTLTDTTYAVDSLMNNENYFWRTKAHNAQGWGRFNKWNRFKSSPTSVEENKNIPATFKLYQNYPNPFNPTTTIEYEIKNRGHVKLEIYDLLGREVKTLTDGVENPGRYKKILDMKNMPSGIYIYTLQTQNHNITKKMLLIK